MKIKKYLNPNNGIIRILDLPKEYVVKYPNMKVTTPSGLSLTLSEAYNKYGETPIKRSDVPHLTDIVLHQDQNDIQDARQMAIRQGDREADAKSPGAGTFVITPLALTAAGIGGATALPYLLPGTLGGNIIGTTAFGEALNHAIKYGTGKTMGEHAVNAAHYLGIPESQWGDFGIQFIGDTPVYLTGDLLAKGIKTGAGMTREALLKTALDKLWFPTTKDLAKAINTEVKNKQFTNLFPGQIGWAPKQTITGVHASDNPNLKFDYNFLNWAEREHGAPKGIYFTANQKVPSSGFLNNRQYAYQVKSTFDKPIVQVGDIKTNTKNNIRNQIERAAMDLGADGIIYQDIADNNLKHQTIVKSLNPDQLVEITGVIDRLSPKVTRVVDSNGTIRFQLDSHTPEMPREFVLDPQGDNKFYVHMRTWNGEKIPANMTDAEKNKLFESVYEELPEGAEILFPESSESYPATRGTVAGLIRLSRDPRFQRGNTKGQLIYLDKTGNFLTFDGTSFIKGLKSPDSHLQGEADYPIYTYNRKTGSFDISFPRGLRRRWADEAREDVVLYFESNAEYDRLILSGATPEQALQIMAVRGANTENALPIVFRNLKSNVYGDALNVNGQALVRLNQRSNSKASLLDPDILKHTVYHELGGHGSSLNIGEQVVTIPENQIDILTRIYKHNEALRPKLRPFYQAIKDGNFELAKQIAPEGVLKTRNGEINFKEIQDLIKYMEENLEYVARAHASNIAKHTGLKDGWNIEQLRKYFTDKSTDHLLKNVWTILPLGYGLSQINQSNRKGGKLIQRKSLVNKS